ncbi:DUF4435 domain-containing protein [Francisella sp. LA112445]|uniref:DUF4435 domain-containing protein n=1 Tax=Francisella sp. LA112445 TaxID=1395624 RepID=UPI001788E55F|nr:DUF4435 domain-containing protein [Francisella sp. LA112445]QIW10157.1 DUF4435 domain-containing protein [Francisella sp. LA112445]
MINIPQIIEYIQKAKQFKEALNTDSFNIESIIHEQELSSYHTNKKNYNDNLEKIKECNFNSIISDLNTIQKDYTNPKISDNYKNVTEGLLAQILESEKSFLDNLILIINGDQANIKIYNLSTNLIILRSRLQKLKENIDIIISLDLIKEINQNLILIGANGSGKSTFSRNIKQKINSNYKNNTTIVIPAQRTFFIDNNSAIPLIGKAQPELYKTQKQDKLFKNYKEQNFLYSDFQNLINYLIAEYQKVAHNTHKGLSKESSILEKTIGIWESLINHIKLEYDGQGSIKAKSKLNYSSYNFIELSDGEKCIFYCIANVLTVEENGYVIVDEPENHLNMNIVNKLWDKLEEIRPDCQFIYLTHTPNFATARNNAKIYWVKKYLAPSTWDYTEITDNNGKLSKELVVELVGSKKPILFCEGNDRTSADYKLYSILFGDYTVVPAGGHKQAIAYCKAFNQQKKIFDNEAIAIIDKDFYSDARILAWKDDSIYVLDVMEVENLLCDTHILEFISNEVKAEPGDLENAKLELFKKIEETKDHQSRECMDHQIKEILTDALHTAKDINRVKDEIVENINNKINPKKFYDAHLELLDKIIAEQNYDEALKHYNNKGMLGFVGNKIITNYKNRVFRFIRDDEKLQHKIRTKYFAEIPSYLESHAVTAK